MKKNTETLRTATVEDFKIGTTLIMSEGWAYTITAKYMDEIWEARGPGGDKIVYEAEAQFYKVKA